MADGMAEEQARLNLQDEEMPSRIAGASSSAALLHGTAGEQRCCCRYVLVAVVVLDGRPRREMAMAYEGCATTTLFDEACSAHGHAGPGPGA
ncbi:MAG: hypothetical protein U1F68_20990 [Gammaproteobacteria bacterium]